MQQHPERHHATQQVKQKLRYVRPDHRLHPAFKGIQHRQGDHDDHRQPLRSPQRHAHHQGNRRHSHTFRKRARHQKRYGRHGPHPLAKTFFDHRVSRQKFSAKISRQKNQGDQESSHKVAEHPLQKRHVAGVRERRRPDNRECRSLRGHDRKRQRPPRRGSSAQKIIAHVPLFPAEVNAQRRHAQQVNNDNRQVQKVDAHAFWTPLPAVRRHEV